MGVKGLWRLLLPIGRRISIETLEGKILAIDASIWLTQFLKAMRDPDTGSVKPAAHLIGFFRRLAKLRFHGIRPVLVFDGATPEIKKREVQRRRQRREQFAATGQAAVQRMAKRLLLEQLKKKRKVAQGSAGSGAFAPGFQLAEDEVVEKKHKSGETRLSDSHEAIMAEVIDLEEEWKEKPLVEDQNDWDAPVEEEVSSETNENDQSDIYNHTYDVFNVDRISSMPSHARKDAVEEAKRQQRMRSRREFMPVAGQPEEYSQAQLRNFLRSSRLNREIENMAKKAVDNDTGIGERVASDATRRIVFTKDADKAEVGWKRLHKGETTSSHKLPPEDEDDEEFEWEDDGETASVKDKASAQRLHAVMGDDSDESVSVEGGGGFLTAKSTAVATKPVIQIDSDSDDAGGGFIVHDGSSTTPCAPSVKEMYILEDDKNDKNVLIATESVDARRAQELEDEMLARALQETEDNPSNEEAVSDAPLSSQKSSEKSNGIVRRLQKAEDADANAFSGGLSKDDSTAVDDDDDSDEVDWEDGDQEDADGILSMSQQNPSQVVQRRELLDSRITLSDQQKRAEDDDSSDDDVNWESGDEATRKDYADGQKQSGFQNMVYPSSMDTIVSAVRGQEGLNARDEGLPNRASKSKSPNKLPGGRKASSSFEEDNGFDRPVADQNAIALEHAQATAANLTNWAGRAFRRAIAAHAEQTAAQSPEKRIHQRTSSEDLEAESEDGKDNAIVADRSSTKTDPGIDIESDSDVVVEESDEQVHYTSSRRQPSHVTVQTPPVTSTSSQDRTSATGTLARDMPPMNLLQDATITLQAQDDILAAEQMREERDMDTMTDEMKAEVIQLIQLFGIPYVESPAEAEAQCVKLEELGLVDGIVTEDSDVFVFGGQSVYKNIFDDQKYVETYLAKDAKSDLALGRNEMVALAMLLGGDYTDGVKGVGIVNGMEVLQAFDVSESVKDGLEKFRLWLDGFDPDDAIGKKTNDEELSAERKFYVKHRTARTQWIAPKNFPADNVLNAYLKPVVDTSTEPFSWGTPDLDKLLVFCRHSMGWEHDETKKLLEPVLQRLTETSRQTRMDSFFMRYNDNIKFANVKSKRLREVFQDIQKASQDTEASNKKARTKKP